MLKVLGWDLTVAPTLSPNGELSEDDVLAPADRALHLPAEAASELARVIKDAELPGLAAIASVGCVAGS